MSETRPKWADPRCWACGGSGYLDAEKNNVRVTVACDACIETLCDNCLDIARKASRLKEAAKPLTHLLQSENEGLRPYSEQQMREWLTELRDAAEQATYTHE